MSEERKLPTLESLLVENGVLKSKEEIIRVLKSCARKGVTINPSFYKQIHYLDKVDFYAQELKSLCDSMKNGIKVCERKRPAESKIVYEELVLYFYSRMEKSRIV